MLAGALLWRRRPIWARRLAIGGLAYLVVAALPLTALGLAALLESYPALDPQQLDKLDAQAIVVLAYDRYPRAPEYGGDTSSSAELARLRYAAWLQRRTGLPIAVIGGDPLNTGIAESTLMARILRDEFKVPVRWVDTHSRTTFDNARYAREVLVADGVRRILLVSHAWHLPRAVRVFQSQGFDVIPAPTAFTVLPSVNRGLGLFIPSTWALITTNRALHELLGTVWYGLFR